MASLSVADSWFHLEGMGDGVTRIVEPHVTSVFRANIWHIRGRDRDLFVDTGMGVGALRSACADLARPGAIAVATHGHVDHAGGLHEFDVRIAHAAEADALATQTDYNWLDPERFEPAFAAVLRCCGFSFEGGVIDALPSPGYDPARYRMRAAPPTRCVEDGETVDLGDRVLEIVHLPGHSAGSIGLLERATGILFSGDAIYEGTLVADLPGGSREDYLRTMERLRELPIRIVHPGHHASFGRETLLRLIEGYLRSSGAPSTRELATHS